MYGYSVVHVGSRSDDTNEKNEINAQDTHDLINKISNSQSITASIDQATGLVSLKANFPVYEFGDTNDGWLIKKDGVQLFAHTDKGYTPQDFIDTFNAAQSNIVASLSEDGKTLILVAPNDNDYVHIYDPTQAYSAGTIISRNGGIFKLNEDKPAGD
jgi:hypothetical protein